MLSRQEIDDPVALFTRAYEGKEQVAGMEDFQTKLWMRVDADAAGVPWSKLLSSAQWEALALIRKSFPSGCTVLDIGCGTGYFMRALRDLRYNAVGLDVARPVIEQLSREGFQVWLGPVDTTGVEWVDPVVCTSFFTLHHQPDPVGFFRAIRTRFPTATLIVAVYNDLDGPHPQRITPRAQPPRTYSWWGKDHVQLALEKGGYEATTSALTPQAREGGHPLAMTAYALLRRRVPFLARWMLAWYYRALPLIGRPGALWMRWRRRSKYLLAVGRPGPEAS